MKRILLLLAGSLLLALAIIGIFLPLLPATPFAIGAAACFSMSSERAYRFLVKNRFIGPYIENYRLKKGIPVKAKVRSIVFLWVALAASAILAGKPWLWAALCMVGIGVTLHLLLMKTRRD